MHPELDIGNPEKRLNGKLARFKIDPKAGSNELELPVVLSEVAGEMGRCDDRFITRPYNNAFGARHSPRGFDAVIHVDIAAGVTNIWEPGEGIAVGEPCFVPRQKDSPEGDGYLLVCTRDAAKRQAQLSILDAKNIIAGPVCIVELPFQLCEGVHGNWVCSSRVHVSDPNTDEHVEIGGDAELDISQAAHRLFRCHQGDSTEVRHWGSQVLRQLHWEAGDSDSS